MSRNYWLDFGGGDAEYSEHLAGSHGKDGVFISMDPMLRSHMIEAKAVRPRAALPANVLRIAAGLGPSDDCSNNYLPFRDDAFDHVVCRFVLHLYLTVVEPFISEAYRVLTPGGDLTLRIPDWENSETTTSVAFIARALADRGFVVTELGRAKDEMCSLWDEIYEGRVLEMKAGKRST